MGSLLCLCVLIGQVEYPIYVSSPPALPIIWVMPEHQIIQNINERDRFYVKIILSNGYRTEIPVINGYLPKITEFRSSDGVTLCLNYAEDSSTHYSKVDFVDRIQFSAVDVITKPAILRPVRPDAPIVSETARAPKPDAPIVSEPKPEPKPMPLVKVEKSRLPVLVAPLLYYQEPVPGPVQDSLEKWLRNPSEVE